MVICLGRGADLHMAQLGPPIPTTFGNTGISVLEKTTTGIPVLIPVFCSISEKAALACATVKTSQVGSAAGGITGITPQ